MTGSTISDEALVTVAAIARRLASSRTGFLPDKAIDLIDEAASRVRINFGMSAPYRSSRKLEAEDGSKAIRRGRRTRP